METVNLGKHTYSIQYQPGESFNDLMKEFTNIVKQFGYSLVDSDESNFWYVYEKTPTDNIGKYYLKIGLLDGTKIYCELWEGWDKQKHTGSYYAPNSRARSDNLNGNQRFDSTDGGIVYVYVSERWLFLGSKTVSGIGDYRWDSITGVTERQRQEGETKDKGCDYPAVCYIALGQLIGGWNVGPSWQYIADNRVGFTRVYNNSGVANNVSSSTSFTNGIMYYSRGGGYGIHPFAWRDNLTGKFRVYPLKVGYKDYILNGYLKALKQISGNVGNFMDVAVIKCNSEFIPDNNGQDTEHWIITIGKGRAERFIIPK